MNCKETRNKIRETVENDKSIREDETVARHIGECELCRHLYSDLVIDLGLSRTLKEMPVPEPPPDFAAKAVRYAVSSHRFRGGRSFFMGASAAAVLIIAVGVSVLMRSLNPAGSVTDVLIPVGGEKTVRIMIDAVEPRKNALLSIALAGDVAIKDFPGQNRLKWRTDLSRGGNLLALPLLLKDRAGGDVNVRYTYNGTEKEVRIQVRAEKNGPVRT